MDKFKGVMPTIKVPKKIKKIRQWNATVVVDSINNLSQLVYRFIHPSNGNPKAVVSISPGADEEHHLPQGISTISGHVITDAVPSHAQKDNFGLYALKCDRNAAKKGILLNIPLKLHQEKQKSDKVTGKKSTLHSKTIHEKFSPCKTRRSFSVDESCSSLEEADEEILQIEIESSDFESVTNSYRMPPVPPRRRRDSSQAVEMNKKRAPEIPTNILKNNSEQHRISDSSEPQKQEPPSTSLASFVHANRSEALFKSQEFAVGRGNSLDIFKQETDNIFDEFDNIFEGHESNEDELKSTTKTKPNSVCSNANQNIKQRQKITKKKASKFPTRFPSSSLSQSSIEESANETEPMEKHLSNSEGKSIPPYEKKNSMNKKIGEHPLIKSNTEFPMVGKIPSIKDLKSPRIVAACKHDIGSKKKVPQSILKQNPPITKQVPDTAHQSISEEMVPIEQVSRKFFVYYNDEDELVFNQKYNSNSAVNAASQQQALSIYTVPNTLLVPAVGSSTSFATCYKSTNDFNHVDAIYKNYYCEQSDSLRSMTSSDGIFI